MHGTICVVGLGTMGRPMARCLGSAGCDLVGWDRDAEARKGLALASLEETALGADTVMTMLPDGESVASVIETLLEQRKDRIFLDCSSIDVATTRRLAGMAAAAGCGFVDAPVSGGPEGAANGTLSFMVGGSPGHVARVRPLLDIMGQQVIHFGETGSGQAAKACHNMICGITMLGVCEAFALAESLDLDAGKFHDLCRGAAAQSWILDNRCPVPGLMSDAPATHDYTPGFAARLMAKDLSLAQQAALISGQTTPFGAEAARRFAHFDASGHGDLDISAIYRAIRRGSMTG
ncbi:MAG: NAD(P)-binding domain-containing protein [bacterium]|nr:NAD(P)-binding domain-containing protein [bacterium]MDE0418366.1 NAD(P)-binding domain-containing protein [bacterium]